MTATAYKLYRRHIKESLGLHNCFEKRHSDTGTDIDAVEDICRPIYAVVYAIKTQCFCVECSLDMERE